MGANLAKREEGRKTPLSEKCRMAGFAYGHFREILALSYFEQRAVDPK